MVKKMLSVDTWVLVAMIMTGTYVASVNGENLAFVTSADQKIYKATLPATVGQSIAFTSVIDISGANEANTRQLGYDPVDRMIYWTDHSFSGPGRISKCDLNGNNRKDFETVDEPYGLALDVVNRTVYFTAEELGCYYIGMDLVGPAVRIETGIPEDDSNRHNPFQLAYGAGRLYYTIEMDSTHGVESINVDGSDRKLLVGEDDDNLDQPRGIYLDDQTVYYGDAEFGSIYSTSIQDSKPGKDVIFTEGEEPQGLTMYRDSIYWCDNNDKAIYRIAKDGSDNVFSAIEVPATFDEGSLDDCYDIHFYIEKPCVSNLLVTSVSSSELSVTWDPASVLCPARWYRVQYEAINVDQCDSEVGSPTILPWQTNGQSQNFAMLEGLKAYTAYRVSVAPGLGQDLSVVEEGESVETTHNTTEAAPSQSPLGVQYIITVTSVILTWLEIPCGSRRGLPVHYEYKMFSNGVMVASGMDATREITLDKPSCGSVTFQVAGVNSAGKSNYSTISFDVISTEPFMPNTGLQISGIPETTADISWDKTACPPSDYTVKYTLVKLGQCRRNTEFNYGSIGKEETASVNLNGLEPGSEYEIIVCATNKDGDQRLIREDFVTPESVPSDPPRNLQISYATGGLAQITWDAIPCESRGGSSFYYSYKVLVAGVERRSGQTSETSFIEPGSLYHNADGQVEFMVAGATESGTGMSSRVSYDANLAGLCPQPCGIHGDCDSRTNICLCRAGYTGESCETSICIAQCKNGGECSKTGQCLCPPGFMGTQCQMAILVSNGLPTSTVEGQYTVISCDGIPAVFTGDLNIEGSTAREDMLRKTQPLLVQYLGSIPGVIAVGNVQFSPGSIVVSFTVTAEAETTISDIDSGLNNLVQSAQALTGLTINPGSARIFTDGLPDLCPEGYCKNGGTCTVDVGGIGMTCTCASGYDGLQCDDKVSSNISGGAIAGIMVGVFGFIVAAILVGMCFCIYMRQRQVNTPQLPPNLNTLDLAKSPYTYPRNDLNALLYN